MSSFYSCDFETTTRIKDCRVWLFGVYDIYTEDFICGNNIDDFMSWCLSGNNPKCYFHNLKFDGEFIIYWLLKNGYKHTTDKKCFDNKTFKTLISSNNLFYSITVQHSKKGHKSVKCEFFDSLKLIPLSVDKIAKSFNLSIKKGSINYSKYRKKNYEPSENEIEYVKNDVEIVGQALKILLDEGLTKMTIGSNALNDFKKIFTIKKFNQYFPIHKYDSDLRQSYKGGFTYLSPKYAEKEIKNGVVFDVNSLYPFIMYSCKIPYGYGVFFNGQYQNDNLYDLYIQQIKCSFKLKDNFIPTIQIKNNLQFIPTQYLISSENEEVLLTLTSVDYELFVKHYDIFNIEFISGWKFKSVKGLFCDYIDKWINIKIQSEKEGNYALRSIAKLMLNSLYGKFATNPNCQSKIPYLENDIVKYRLGDKEKRDPVYVAVSSFITAYARSFTINAAQQIKNDFINGKSNIDFIYADTDSLHCLSPDHKIPKSLEIDPYKLGAWKHEKYFNYAKFLRAKCYIENSKNINENDYKLNVVCAGMPETCHKFVTKKNFCFGSSFTGKLQINHVSKGIILLPTTFTIKK